ncbi:hypothetical protein NNJEOMEG_00560 [Fundidesulfovibrio magnetotacticus]|uniref:Lipoprotein n=1 Tax=Fundidesulfovibrio magnetotacticus TaxID=2730080 RepID=A0A6V8LJ32_9BACT|nr:hypothetical protein [Fundidesulfovibrio magnetotacticus]GFK92733.1 hypothetical protein NNJEOMEG_00560 [Fundidesulfovibrio magnetotacticus]
MRPLALTACLAACLLLAACAQEPPERRSYRNDAVGLRFHPAKGWTVAETTEDGCTFAVEASNGPDLRFVICLSPPRTDILLTQNAFVSCENVKQYVAESLKGIKPTCMRGGAGDHFGYDTLYARLLRGGDGKVRVQFVNHVFAPVKGRLLQVMAYAVADDDKQAHALFDANRAALFAMMQSVRLR